MKGKDMEKTESITRHAEVSEKMIEGYLVQEVKNLGGICLKYSNPNMVGYPDRLVCLPGGHVAWVELKSKGKKPTRIQRLRMEDLRNMNFEVHVVDTRQDVDRLTDMWRERI